MNIPIFNPCTKCNNGYIINQSKAYKCSCLVQYQETLRFIQSLIQGNLINEYSSNAEVERLMNYTLSDYKGKDKNNNIPKLRKFIDKFDTYFNNINLFFSGGLGTQKSTVAKGILTSLIRQSKTVYYILGKDLIDFIMQAERDENIKAKVEYILHVDCLVLEEFEESKLALYASGYKQKVLAPFLKNRLESIRKSTIFIANIDVSEMKVLGEMIGDLIYRETLQGQFYFTDRYVDYMDKIDLQSIWD